MLLLPFGYYSIIRYSIFLYYVLDWDMIRAYTCGTGGIVVTNYYLVNLGVGTLCLYVAFGKPFRPISWMMFKINIFFGILNYSMVVLQFFK